VRTAVVHGVYLAVVEEERERTTGEANGDAPGGAYLVQPTGSHKVVRACLQPVTSFPPIRSL
jgi:hypothetical protein